MVEMIDFATCRYLLAAGRLNLCTSISLASIKPWRAKTSGTSIPPLDYVVDVYDPQLNHRDL